MPKIQTGDSPVIDARDALDQRKQTRFVCVDGGVMRLSVRPEYRGRRAMLVDLSTGGIGFLVEEPLECEAMVVFELQGPGDDGPIKRRAIVRHCRTHPTPADASWAAKSPALSRILRGILGIQAPIPTPPSWLIGCEFEKPLDPAELQLFLDRLRIVQEFGEI